MNPKEEMPIPIERRDVSAPNEQQEAILLSLESREALEELTQELENLRNRMTLPETQKIPFTAPGGEQELGKQMIALQKEKIPQIFKDVEFEGPHLFTHDVQKEKYSCQLASVGNVLKALGIQVTEKEIAEAIGKSGESANIWPEELSDYLKSKGLDITRVNSLLEAINALIKGEKIVWPLLPPKYQLPHTVVISGIKIARGKVEFYVNDPQYKNYAEALSVSDVVDGIIPYSFHKLFPTYAVYKKRAEQDIEGK